MKKILLSLLILVNLNANKLVVLEPSAVEILYELDSFNNILAIANTTTSTIYPEDKTKQLLSVGTYTRPNIEKIIELKPDIVITSQHSLGLEKLKEFNIKILDFKANSFKELKNNIAKLGEITNKKDKAQEIIKEFELGIKEFHNLAKDKTAMFIFSSNPIMLFCDNNLANDVIKAFGMKNICDLKEQTPIVNKEYIISKNPDYIFYFNDGDLKIISNFLKHTKAFKNNNLIKTNSSSMLRASPRIIINMKELSKEL